MSLLFKPGIQLVSIEGTSILLKSSSKGKYYTLYILEGRINDEIPQLLDAAHAAMVEAFGVLESDRFQVVHEHKPRRVRFGDIGLGIKGSDRRQYCDSMEAIID